MFKNSDFYDLDAAMQRVNDTRISLGTLLEVEALKLLLDKKGLVSASDMDACIAYLRTTPKIQALYEQLAESEAKIREYQRDPQRHLQDIFKAKLDGTIR